MPKLVKYKIELIFEKPENKQIRGRGVPTKNLYTDEIFRQFFAKIYLNPASSTASGKKLKRTYPIWLAATIGEAVYFK